MGVIFINQMLFLKKTSESESYLCRTPEVGGDPPREELRSSELAGKGNWFLSSPCSGMGHLWLLCLLLL